MSNPTPQKKKGRAGKIVLEVLAAMIVIIVGGVVFLALSVQNVGQNNYDIFSGIVEKQPINVVAPMQGELVAVGVHEGDTVHAGQTLAMFKATNPADLMLYKMDNPLVAIKSPSDGVVGKVYFAPGSSVAGAASILQVNSPQNMSILVLVPKTYKKSDYTGFSAAPPGAQSGIYTLHINAQVSTDILPNVDPTTSVYRATCQANCTALMQQGAVAVFAQRPQPKSPILDQVRSILNKL